VVRDETCRTDTDSRDEAFRIAQVLVSDGFTVWIWAVDARSVPAQWTLVERIGPSRRATDRQRARAGRQSAAERAEVAAA
jgi:hypothetical protein